VRKASILAQDVVFQKKPPLPPSPPARVMRPAPVLKLLGSPVFQGGRGRAATFGGKNGKLRSFTPDRTARRSCSRMRWRAAARQTGLKIGGVRPGRDDPLVKIDPPRDPPFLTSRRSHPCIYPCVSLSFLTTRYGSQDQPTRLPRRDWASRPVTRNGSTNCKVSLDRRGPKLRPDDCGDGDGPTPPFRTIQARPKDLPPGRW
jgi:hypothetical protein